MASILYAEVYLICLVVIGLLLYWTVRKTALSTGERWLRRVLIAFLINFCSNFFFTLFNGVNIVPALQIPASYFFKTAYHLSLCVGVFAWCGYAESVHKSPLFETKKSLRLLLIPLLLPLAAIVLNLWTHWLFDLSETGAYRRHFLFQIEIGYLLVGSVLCAVRLMRARRFESDPPMRSHMLLTSSFPLCILAAWILSFFGESVPVICVCIMIELLCLYMGTTTQQVSLDKLTQVNNRINLLSYLDYKLKNHEESLFLLMVDVDHFKSINDTYGHLEGDAALVLVASALKHACGGYKKRPYIARYGGDEFIVVAEATREEIDLLCDAIRAALAQSAKASARPYELSISIGIAKCEDGMDGKALIANADERMYRARGHRIAH